MLLAAGALVLAGGCATRDEPTPAQRERQRAAVERYDRCLERRVSHLAAAELGARRIADCEGHRRDVLKTYPAHREAQVARLLDERAARQSDAASSAAANATTRPIIERIMELISGD